MEQDETRRNKRRKREIITGRFFIGHSCVLRYLYETLFLTVKDIIYSKYE